MKDIQRPIDPPCASLFSDEQLISEGQALVDEKNHSITFWPNDREKLDIPYPRAMMQVHGFSGVISVVNVHQCPASLSHWEMKF